jgi:glyoxylase-like metal-dependent hydrolase (beta-lactamase superfamily II)
MARPEDRLPDNAPGDVYVDASCIDCGTCRNIAPAVFAEAGDHSYVHEQPADPAARLRALMALVSCPTGSIGTVARTDPRPAIAALPEEILPGVYYCGFTSDQSFGASSWLLRRPEGNVLVDSPRAARPLLEAIRALGGISLMFLTHRDDVADHAVFARAFNLRRILHAADMTPATADVELPLDIEEPTRIADDLLAIPVPGHTRGSTALLWRDEVLFSGDHLWGTPEGRLHAARSVCWWSWPAQKRSVERLLGHDFGHVLPGHGGRWHGGHAAREPALRELLTRM